MAKPTEKLLYNTCLDIAYAHELNEELLGDLEGQIKEIRKQRNKTKRLLKKAIEHYKSIYNREPDLGRTYKGMI